MKRQIKKKAAKGAVRRLTKTGTYTFYVTIPKTDIDALGWRERQRVSVRKSGKSIVVEALRTGRR